jgi:hypothetical protein
MAAVIFTASCTTLPSQNKSVERQISSDQCTRFVERALSLIANNGEKTADRWLVFHSTVSTNAKIIGTKCDISRQYPNCIEVTFDYNTGEKYTLILNTFTDDLITAIWSTIDY